MECYLHIGTQKTGSTTLQEFLFDNRSSLARQGYFVPQSSGRKKDWLLMVACHDPGRQTRSMHNLGIHSDRQLESFRARILNALKQECSDAHANRVILSCEDFHGLLTTRSELVRLKDALAYIGCDTIKVIIYLRDPAELANSKYTGMVAGGAIEKLPPPPEEYKHHCDHRQSLMRWSEVFGDDNIQARIHEKASLVNGSVLDDFMYCIGASLTPDMVLPRDANTALSRDALELIRRVNEKLNRSSLYQTFLREALTQYIVEHHDGPKYVMPEEMFRAYDTAYAESNEWVRTHWFPERRQLYTREHRPNPSMSAIPETQLDKMADSLVSSWRKKHAVRFSIWKRMLKTYLFRLRNSRSKYW